VTTHPRAGARQGGVLVALLAVALLAWVGPWVTRSTTGARLDLTMSFDELLPGETRSESTPVELPVAVRVGEVRLHEVGPRGGVRWAAELCPESGDPCVDLLARGGTPSYVAAGRAAIVVTVTELALGPGGGSSLVGRITFDEVGTLAITGPEAVPSLVATAAALVSTGALLVVLARRRRAVEPDGAPC